MFTGLPWQLDIAASTALVSRAALRVGAAEGPRGAEGPRARGRCPPCREVSYQYHRARAAAAREGLGCPCLASSALQPPVQPSNPFSGVFGLLLLTRGLTLQLLCSGTFRCSFWCLNWLALRFHPREATGVR